MSKKIFRTILLVALIVFASSLILIMGSTYSYFSGEQENQLEVATNLAAEGAALSGEEYFKDLEEKEYRITWINEEGKILYDTDADPDSMENHLEREEVQEALKDGFGTSSRYSATLSKKYFYAAELLPDGSVVRLSKAQNTIGMLLLAFLQPIIIVAIIVIILSFILASRLSRKIVEPINRLNLDDPLADGKSNDYVEIEPLLHRIDSQQKQLKRDKEEIGKAAMIREDFTANVSHELKTPLHAISGYAELLKSGMVKEEDRQAFAEKIYSESERMSKLVSDIIDLTKLDQGAPGMQKRNADIYRISKNAVDALAFEAEKAQVAVEITGDHAQFSVVPEQFYSIIYNLCDNAIKYNKPGGHVTINIADGSDSCDITVKDEGIGIPKESLERIFERFYRVDKSHSKEVGGTGLGLSIVKHAAKIHDASVNVSSEEGHGTAFTVSFPK